MRKRILVVDDDEGILGGFEAILSTEGYEVETSLTGNIFKDLHKKHLPQLIILDVLLSGQDGREICKDLKTYHLTKDIPIIMVSAHPGAEKSVAKSGADDYLRKPFEMNDLLAKVAKYL